MTRSYDELKDELRLQRNHSLLKTYLLEAHTATDANHEQLFLLVSAAFGYAGRNHGRTSLTVSETKEEDLFYVTGSNRRGIVSLFVDTTDSRFWLAHALSKSDASDSTINGVLSSSSAIDSAWMPIELLESVMDLGESRGLALDFDRRYLDYYPKRKSKSSPIDIEVGRKVARETTSVIDDKHLEYAKLQLWGNGSERILDALNKANLTNSTTLSKVRLRNEDDVDDGQFALSDVKYDGKITGRGTSFDTYNALLLSVRNRYAQTIRTTEERYQIRWAGGSNASERKGEPFYIKLGEHGINNLEHFCARIFSGADPFRLLALPVKRNANFYTASAVDLHVNQRIDFEVTRDLLTAYLPGNVCGNTLLRLYTNLQHYFSSDVKAVHGSGERVFAF